MKQEPWPTTDHDTLIEIRTLVSELKHDINRLRDGTHSQLIEHDKRIRAVEDLMVRIQPLELIAKSDRVYKEWDDFRSRLKVYVSLVIFIAGILGAALSQVIRIWLETNLGK
jgi:hypothetical protein